MIQSVWWYVLAGFAIGFILSTLWEWLFFRRRRMHVESRRIAELEATVRSLTRAGGTANSPIATGAATGYQGPGVFLENEQVETKTEIVEPDNELRAEQPHVDTVPPPASAAKGRNGFVSAAAPAVAAAATTTAVLSAESKRKNETSTTVQPPVLPSTPVAPVQPETQSPIVATAGTAALLAAEASQRSATSVKIPDPVVTPVSEAQTRVETAPMSAGAVSTAALLAEGPTQRGAADTKVEEPLAPAVLETRTPGQSAPESAAPASTLTRLSTEPAPEDQASPAVEQPRNPTAEETPPQRRSLPAMAAAGMAALLAAKEPRNNPTNPALQEPQIPPTEQPQPETSPPASNNGNGIAITPATAAAVATTGLAAALAAEQGREDAPGAEVEQPAAPSQTERPPLNSFLPVAAKQGKPLSNGSISEGTTPAARALPAAGIQPGIQRVSGELDNLLVSLQGLIDTTEPLVDDASPAGALESHADTEPAVSGPYAARNLSRAEFAVVRLMQSARQFGRDLRSLYGQQ